MRGRILLVLDDSGASKAAKSYAIQLAKRSGASLTGLAVIDTPWITAAQPEPLGGAAYKIHRDAELIRQTHAHMKKMLETFAKKCKEALIRYTTCEREGFPVMEIEKLSQEHDLIVIGRTTEFHFDFDQENDLTVKHITRDCPRPIIVLSAHPGSGNNVLIAYDGSLQAARALHMYLLLDLAKGHNVHIISIARHQTEADEIARRAQNMCESRGVKATCKSIVSDDPPEAAIIQTAKDIDAGLVVMGAFGHHGIREFFFGSCTDHIMKTLDIPLFIHH